MWLLREGRDALVLSIAQALFWAGLMMSITFTGLVGLNLASSPSLATLPVALLTVANIAAAGPISLLMQRLGRRAGFALGAAAGAAGGCIAAYAIVQASFLLFCVGNLFLGVFQASTQYYRLAAADDVAPERRARAVSVVMAGGVAAAMAAPALAVGTKDLLGPAEYAGSFLGLAALAVATLVPLAFLSARRPRASGGAGAGEVGASATPAGRPLAVILRQPIFVAAFVNVAVGHAVMVLVMHATPLAMVAASHGVADAADVIRLHVLGMFVPSFFSGRLIERFGTSRIAVVGVVALAASVACSATGLGYGHFQAGLLLLGIGWNFLFVAGSTLLTRSHAPEERGRVQGVFEMAVAACAAAASFGSAGLLHALGWQAVNLGALPLLLLALVVTVRYAARASAPRMA